MYKRTLYSMLQLVLALVACQGSHSLHLILIEVHVELSHAGARRELVCVDGGFLGVRMSSLATLLQVSHAHHMLSN